MAPLLSRLDPGQWPGWAHLLPPLLLAAVFLLVVAADASHKEPPPAPPPPAVVIVPEKPAAQEEDLLDTYPRLGCLFHDRGDALIPQPSMRFGLVLLREKDPRNPARLKKLTYDELGRSNNTCLRIDGGERLFGHAPGRWRTMAAALGNDEHGRPRQGLRSVWFHDREKVAVTQQVEIVPGEQTRLLDTCLVRYTLVNEHDRPHRVGLRFLLDTYIGANDGVPFAIPRVKGLCDSMMRFDGPEAVPEFIQALERESLEDPGTIAHLRLKLGGPAEPPGRVTLGSWPDPALAPRAGPSAARAQLTGWEVPVLPIKTLAPADSAVTIYWDERPLEPGKPRELGFAYGLVGIASHEGKGELAVTVGGSFLVGGEFVVTAYVSRPAAGQTVTLSLPADFTLVEGDPTQAVPPIPAGAGGRNSVVTWKVRSPRREGKYVLRVSSSTGVAQTQPVSLRSKRLFD